MSSPSSVISFGYGSWGSPSLVITLGYGAAEFVASISVTLTDVNNIPIPNLTGLSAAWWDIPTLASQGPPIVTWTALITDGSGILSVFNVPGSALTSGQTGWIEVTDSDGTVSQSPVGKVAAGPITVQ